MIVSGQKIQLSVNFGPSGNVCYHERLVQQVKIGEHKKMTGHACIIYVN